MSSERRLLRAALEQGLLQQVAAHCQGNTLAIHAWLARDEAYHVVETAKELLIRLDGKTVQLTLATFASLQDLHYLHKHLQCKSGPAWIVRFESFDASTYFDSDCSLIVQHDPGPAVVDEEFMAFAAAWRRWVAENQARLLVDHQVCTLPTRSGPIYLYRMSIEEICQLADGLYWRHKQWKRRLRYLFLALDCSAPIVEAVLWSQRADAAAFQIVELLLAHGFCWGVHLVRLARGDDFVAARGSTLTARFAGRRTDYFLDLDPSPLAVIKSAIT
jgi:hypothetical protein